MPGAFDGRGDDIVALYNHNFDAPLGRTSAGTLRLSVDETGLRYSVDLPDTSTGNDLAASVTRGDINGSSFGFTVPEGGAEYTRDSNGDTIRELRQVDLIEVSPVVFPAYAGTSAQMQRCGGTEEIQELIRSIRQQQARKILAEVKFDDYDRNS